MYPKSFGMRCMILLPLYYRVRFEVTLFKLIGGSFSFVTLNILFSDIWSAQISVVILWVWKNNCVNANHPEKRTKAKNAAKQGNAGEWPDAAARYTVKSSGANSLLFILHRYLPADKLRGSGCLPQWGRCHGVTEGLVWRKSHVIA